MIFENPHFPNDGFVGKEPYDGLRLEVFGQYQCQQYDPGDDEVCISISSKGHGVLNPRLSPKFVDVLRLHFDDVSIGDADNPDAKTITPHQAAHLANFVIKHKDKKKIVVHCFAGMSRSRSTAAAITTALGLPFNFRVLNWSVYNAVLGQLEKVMEARQD